MNRPRGGGRAALRIPPEAAQVEKLFTGWREELATCRKFAPAERPGQQRGEGLLVDLPGGQGVIQRAVAAAELRYQRQLDQRGHRVIGAQDRVAQLEARIRPGGQAPVQPGTELPQRQVPVNRAGDLRRVRRGRQHCRRRGRGRHRQRELLPAGQRCENMVVQRSLPRNAM